MVQFFFSTQKLHDATTKMKPSLKRSEAGDIFILFHFFQTASKNIKKLASLGSVAVVRNCYEGTRCYTLVCSVLFVYNLISLCCIINKIWDKTQADIMYSSISASSGSPHCQSTCVNPCICLFFSFSFLPHHYFLLTLSRDNHLVISGFS